MFQRRITVAMEVAPASPTRPLARSCICHDHCSDDVCYYGDVNAAMDYGFDSIKLDGCGAVRGHTHVRRRGARRSDDELKFNA